jgi:hypothetical protein
MADRTGFERALSSTHLVVVHDGNADAGHHGESRQAGNEERRPPLRMGRGGRLWKRAVPSNCHLRVSRHNQESVSLPQPPAPGTCDALCAPAAMPWKPSHAPPAAGAARGFWLALQCPGCIPFFFRWAWLFDEGEKTFSQVREDGL